MPACCMTMQPISPRRSFRACAQDAALNVAANVPYVISRDADYAVPIHGDDRGIPAVLVEIRQDLLTEVRHRGLGKPPGGGTALTADAGGTVSNLSLREVTRTSLHDVVKRGRPIGGGFSIA